MIPLGTSIYLRRRQLGLTQQKLAQMAGIPQPNLSNIEKGKQDLTVSTLQRVAHALECPVTDFFSSPFDSKFTLKLTRQRVSRIARAVTDSDQGLSNEEKGLVQQLRKVCRQSGNRYQGIHEMHEAWIWLKSNLSEVQIKTLLERVEEYSLKHHESKKN